MKKLTAAFILATAAFVATGCSDAEIGDWTTRGKLATIECDTGKTYRSTGKPDRTDTGWIFKDTKTGQMREVGNNCTVSYDP